MQRLGIVGGGQLGRMLTFEAHKMGFYVTVIDPTLQSPAGQVADAQIVADYKDAAAIKKLSENSDIITFEIELANDSALHDLIKKGKSVHPNPKTLGIIRDKLKQKQFLKKNNILTAQFLKVETREDITAAGKKFGYPFLLKARTDAYDGRGNAFIKKPTDIDTGLAKLSGRALYVEKFVPFTRELAVIVARSTRGQIKTYPVAETFHKNNICHIVIAPARVDRKIQKKAQLLAATVMKKLKGAGVFGIEMFLTKNGRVLVNEIAPRVHNCGHHTIESNFTSQFEQHIRAISGLPLGATRMKTPVAVMINILGERNGHANIKGVEKALAIAGVSVHIYGKAETRIERKMGHITVVGDNIEEVLRRAKRARRLITV